METGVGVGIGFEDHQVLRIGAEIHDLGVYLCTEEKCPSILKEDRLICIPER